MADYTKYQSLGLRLISKYGFPATLTHIPGGASDTVTITPLKLEDVGLDGGVRDSRTGRVIQRVATTTIAGTDPGLTSPPRPGDRITFSGKSYQIIPGESEVKADAGPIVFKLRMVSA